MSIATGRLAGRVAIISGAAKGQGAAEAALFAAEGAQVVLGDVLVERVHETAAAIGPNAHAIKLDVTKEDDWAAAIALAVGLGPLKVLVNNAGILWQRPLEHENADDLRRILDVNLVGTFNGMQAARGPMHEAGGGSIINISSLAGLTGYVYHGAYGASKWAIRGLTRTAAVEWGPLGIRVNSIHPGPINTDMLPPPRGGLTEDNRFRGLPLGRAGEVDEVAKLALFLASDDSSYQTGAEFVIDGGSQAGPPPGYVWRPPPSAAM
jgi:3alpha(or 20beta)-hydroxysteroid dehydrogenase